MALQRRRVPAQEEAPVVRVPAAAPGPEESRLLVSSAPLSDDTSTTPKVGQYYLSVAQFNVQTNARTPQQQGLPPVGGLETSEATQSLKD